MTGMRSLSGALWLLLLPPLLLALAGCSPRPPKHGTRLVLAPVTNDLVSPVSSADLSNATRILKQRFDLAGFRRPFLEFPNEGGLVVLLPTMSMERLAKVRRTITNTGRLEFRMVHPESAELVPHGIIDPGYELLQMAIQTRQIPVRGSQIIVQTRQGPSVETLLVKKQPERGLTGRYVKRAYVTREQYTQRPQIGFELNAEGTQLFAQITREFSPVRDRKHRLAMVLNGELISAPVINGPIEEGRAVIDGNFTLSEAFEFALVLEAPSSLPWRIVGEREF